MIYRQGQLHNLLASVQNENVGPLIQKAGKNAIKCNKTWNFFLSSTLSSRPAVVVFHLLFYARPPGGWDADWYSRSQQAEAALPLIWLTWPTYCQALLPAANRPTPCALSQGKKPECPSYFLLPTSWLPNLLKLGTRPLPPTTKNQS